MSSAIWFASLAVGILLLYVGIVGVMSLAQSRLFFPTHLAAFHGPPLPASAARLEIGTPDGERLSGVRLGPADRTADRLPLLMGFGGNAWNAETMALLLHDLLPGAEVVAFHYRGYAPSTGYPSVNALLGDALTIFDHLERESARRIIPVGFSIGSGVAAYLARHRPVAGMILVTPFDSLEALAREHFPWAPVGLVLRHRMSLVDFVRESRVPTAVIAAGRDSIVPHRRTEPLRRAVPNLVFDRTIADAGHNDLYGDPAFAGALRDALARIEAAGGR
jgi:uncharacterized protein